jgi:hypothetical protein
MRYIKHSLSFFQLRLMSIDSSAISVRDRSSSLKQESHMLLERVHIARVIARHLNRRSCTLEIKTEKSSRQDTAIGEEQAKMQLSYSRAGAAGYHESRNKAHTTIRTNNESAIPIQLLHTQCEFSRRKSASALSRVEYVRAPPPPPPPPGERRREG